MVSSSSYQGKSNAFTNRVAQDHVTAKIVAARNFKVYAENDKLQTRGRDSVPSECKRKSVPVKSGICQLNGSESKGIPIPAKINVGRKVLADISNVRANFLRNKLHEGSKSLASVGVGTRPASSSSRKPLMGKMSMNPSQSAGDCHDLKRVATKDLKISCNKPSTKAQARKSINAFGSTSRRDHLPPTRNSFPVVKHVKQTSTIHRKKENADDSGKSKGKYGFPVKPKFGRKGGPQASNPSSHFWRKRVSDGFIVMASKSELKVDAQVLSRKSVKPILKTAATISSNQRTIKSKCTAGTSVSSSRKKEVVMKPSLSEHVASIVPHERADQEVLSDRNLEITASDIIARRNSDRRRSYTSLLIARPKVLKEHGELTKQEILPNIYDDCNELEVAEYVDEIYQFYWVMEADNQSLKNYTEIQTDVTPQMRGILVNWLIEVHSKFDLMQETLYLMVTLLDRYLSLVSIKKNEMQLVGLTALLLASKYEDFWHPRVMDLISISAEPYTRDQMLGMEKAILKKLNFRLNAPTPYVFMLRFLKAAQSDDTKFEHLAFYLIELCLVEYEALKFRPSLLCASAIYVARCTLQMSPAWNALLGKHARYDESQIRECAEMILRFHKSARTAMLKVTYEKYMSLGYSRVSAIKPLDRLPL